MKKTTFAIAALMFALTVQAYVPMLKDGNTWNELEIVAVVGSNETSELRTYIRKMKDEKTEINGTYYRQFSTTESEDTSKFSDYPLLLREDIETQKIYIYNATLEKEILLYSFDVEIGDTVYDAHINGVGELATSNLIVNSIDSVEDLDGNKYRAITLKSSEQGFLSGEEIKWIEGFGTPHGLYYANYGLVGGPVYQLLCVHNNNETMLRLSNNYGCFIWDENYQKPSSTNTVIDASKLIVYNRESEELNIDVNTTALVYIYDTQGKMVDKINKPENKTNVAFKSTRGIYVVKIATENGKNYICKIII